jgi:hypothetical protein
MQDEFPQTTSDSLFGAVIDRCWHGKYASIRAIEQDVVSVIGEDNRPFHGIDDAEAGLLFAECQEYLMKASPVGNSRIYKT